MILVSNFANSKKSDKPAVAICRGVPYWFKGTQYVALAPEWSMVEALKGGSISESTFTIEYKKILDSLDVHKVYKDLDGKLLCCWCGKGKFCHRNIVKDWFKEAGYECEEL
jgi:hypothetical protein